MTGRERKHGDTKSGYLVRDLDAMHMVMPILMGGRTENEAVASFDIPTDVIDEYLDKKNSERNQETPKYTYLHVFAAAVCRVIQQRPLMNRYIKRLRFFDRKGISVSFIAKKQKTDGAEEALIVCHYDVSSSRPSIDVIHDRICKQVRELRQENKTGSADNLTYILKKLPRPIFSLAVRALIKLDLYDLLPFEITDSLPYSSTCFISNLGSIKMNAGYHHLINLGSNSFFMIMGTKTVKPVYDGNGSFKAQNCIPVSVTIDERIADGIYFGKSLKMLEALLSHPEILDMPCCDVFDISTLSEYDY